MIYVLLSFLFGFVCSLLFVLPLKVFQIVYKSTESSLGIFD